MEAGLGGRGHGEGHVEPVDVLEVQPEGPVLAAHSLVVVDRRRGFLLRLLDGFLGDLGHDDDRDVPAGDRPETLDRAGLTAVPRGVPPMLAVPGPLPPDEDAFAYEVKWDGVRTLASVSDGQVHLESRKLVDITPRYPELSDLASCVGRPVLLDGEVVAFDEAGRPSFGHLQHRMHLNDPRDVRRRMETHPVTFMVFDLLWLEDRFVVELPYVERRQLLESLGLDHPCLSVPRNHVGDGAGLLAATRAQGLEGIVVKRLSSPYEPGRRSRSWVKVKAKPRQDVVVGGWIPGSGNRSGRIGALLAGYYDPSGLRFAGRVGTGFTERTLEELGRALVSLERPTSPFADSVPYKQARFVEPRLVADVEFGEWTAGGTMRHPSFKGLRDDKAPEEVVRETPARQ